MSLFALPMESLVLLVSYQIVLRLSSMTAPLPMWIWMLFPIHLSFVHLTYCTPMFPIVSYLKLFITKNKTLCDYLFCAFLLFVAVLCSQVATLIWLLIM